MSTGEDVKIGDKVKNVSRRGGNRRHFRQPHRPSSSGLITLKGVDESDATGEFYVSVIDAEWIECEDREGWARSKVRYPKLLDITLNVLVRAEPGEQIAPEMVHRTLSATASFPPGPESFETVRANFDRAHFLDDDGCLVHLADRYGEMWRRHLAIHLQPGTTKKLDYKFIIQL